jgi:hypothetical protein
MKKTRINYKKHPEDHKIWISDVIHIRRKRVRAVINWHDYTFEILDSQGISIFSGEKTGEDYESLLRRVKRTLIKLGAKVAKKKVKPKQKQLHENSGTSSI